MTQQIIQFLKEQKENYESAGLIPTLSLLIEDMERIDVDESMNDGMIDAYDMAQDV